jgi:AraC family transcriptional regulator
MLGSQESGGIVLTELRRCGHEPCKRFAERASFRLLLSGSYRERLRNQSCLYEPLTVVFRPSGFEDQEDAGEDGAHFFCFELGGLWLDRVRGHEIPLVDLHGGDLLWLALHVYREYTRMPDPFAPLAIEGLVMQMLAALARTRARICHGAPPPWLQRVISRLHAGLGEDDGLRDLAAVARVHPVHLSRAFRRFTGLTFGEYVQRLRVQGACRHMLNSSLTLGEIASLAGFADQSHLTNVFRTITGFTPAVLRDLLPSSSEHAQQFRPSPPTFHPLPDTLHPSSPMLALGSR